MNLRRVLRIARKDFFEQISNWRVLFYFLYLLMWGAIVVVVQWSGIFPFVIVLDAPGDSRLAAAVMELELISRALYRVVPVPQGVAVPGFMQEQEADLGVIAPPDVDALIAAGEAAPIEFVLAEGNWFTPFVKSSVEARIETLAPPPDPIISIEESTIAVETGARRRLNITPLVPFSTNFLSMILTLLILVDQGSNALFVVPSLIGEERKNGTLRALLVSPLSHLELLTGKLLGVWGYGLATSCFFLLPILLVAPNPLLLAVTVLLSTAVLNLFGLLIGVVFTNEQMARSFVSIFALPWTFSTYLGWLAIDGPWWVDVLLKSLPTVQMGHAMLLALTDDLRGALAALGFLMVQLVVLMGLMAFVLNRQEDV